METVKIESLSRVPTSALPIFKDDTPQKLNFCIVGDLLITVEEFTAICDSVSASSLETR
jgi:hypothetical protein